MTISAKMKRAMKETENPRGRVLSVELKDETLGFVWVPHDMISRYEAMKYRLAKPADLRQPDLYEYRNNRIVRDLCVLMVIEGDVQEEIRATTGSWPKGIKEVVDVKTRQTVG